MRIISTRYPGGQTTLNACAVRELSFREPVFAQRIENDAVVPINQVDCDRQQSRTITSSVIERGYSASLASSRAAMSVRPIRGRRRERPCPAYSRPCTSPENQSPHRAAAARAPCGRRGWHRTVGARHRHDHRKQPIMVFKRARLLLRDRKILGTSCEQL